MKHFILFFSFFSVIAFSVHAQTDAVVLKDGSGTLISNHSSVTDAYGAIPGTLTQAYIIELEDTYTGSDETYPIVFTEKTGASSSNTITLRPAENVSALNITSSMPGNGVVILDNADYVIIDGRPGGVGETKALTINNLGTSSSSNTVILRNGACFNQVRYCNILNATTGSAGRGVLLGTSPSDPAGNSDNLFEYCFFPSGRYQFNSSGTAANPNTRNTIYGCEFQNMIFVGIWGQSGTGKLHIDSNSFYCNTASGDGLFFGVLFDSQNDTVVISNNQMYDMQNGVTGTMRYIHIRSVVAGETNFTDIHNNFLSVNAGNTGIINLAGIEYSGTNPTFGRIAYNTIRVAGPLTSGGIAGNVGSSALLLAASSASSAFEIKNNIFTNERTGGTAGLQHVAFAHTNTNSIVDADYNSYSSATGELIRHDVDVYTDITSYQSVVVPNDANSNDFGPQFISATDLHLDPSNIGVPELAGIPVPDITTDIDGDTRVFPYRGADELLSCSGTPAIGIVTISADTICFGDTVDIILGGNYSDPAIVLQWQSSTDGISYTDIVGETDADLSVSPGENTFFKCIVTCTQSGLSDSTDVITITVEFPPSGGSIAENHTDYTYDFSVTGLTGTGYVFDWDFGDGNTSDLEAPVHTYASNGIYNVSVIISNNCGADTLEYVVQSSVGLYDLSESSGVLLFPNPATETFTLQTEQSIIATQLKIVDATGRVFLEEKNVSLPKEYSIIQTGLEKGIYFVEIESEINSQKTILKLVVN